MADSMFIPNSAQLPNVYVDRYMSFLTPQEWAVLTYMVRRIFGFQKRQDRIAITQFVRGLKSRDGIPLDYGTGLGASAVRAALEGLEKYNLIVKLAENDPGRNEGALFSLQLESDLVDFSGLELRKAEKKARDKARANDARQHLTPSVGQMASVGQSAPPLSDSAPPLCGTVTQYTDSNTDGKTVIAGETPAHPTRLPGGSDAEKKGDALDGMIAFSYLQGKADLSKYPEDTREILGKFCELWKLTPPAYSKKRAGEFAAWIEAGRNLRQACGELGLSVLQSLHETPPRWWLEKQFTPGHPRSILTDARSRAAEIRRKGESISTPGDSPQDDEITRALLAEYARRRESKYAENATQPA